MSRIITRLLALLLLVVFHPGQAGAQQSDRSASLNLGDAVVTGFSGTLIPDAAKLPANKSATRKSSKLPSRLASIEKSVSRTLSAVGRVADPGGASIVRPRHFPAMILT